MTELDMMIADVNETRLNCIVQGREVRDEHEILCYNYTENLTLLPQVDL